MIKAIPIQAPLLIKPKQKRQVRSQFAALCYRLLDGEANFLLITSRRTKRWILPKGWPENNMTPAESAANEAFEEAGVTGDHNERPLGMYIYEKSSLSGESYPCLVTVFSLEVEKVLPDYPEKAERQREWFNIFDTLKRVKEPELKLLIKTFNPT